MFSVFWRLLTGVILCLCVLTPNYVFQRLAYLRYCQSDSVCSLSESEDCLSKPHDWCEWLIPSIYSYIQAEYWDNGFLAYWQLKKIPLFFLAFPTILFSSDVLLKTVFDLSLKTMCSDVLGFRSARAGLPWAGPPMQICAWVHLMALMIFATFFMNIEVVTRLIWSSSPLSKLVHPYLMIL